ncbi:GGDEF domain-containing protein [Parasphingorhabdus sp.]|uniref:GGDEF domain-containing protein n=1 Tax=Parasphingorhabdus sp. TaxID=2709688 RepID=UPI003263FCBC
MIYASTGLFWLFSFALTKAIYIRCGSAFPVALTSAMVAVSVSLFVFLTYVAPDISVRSTVVNVTAAGLLALSLPPLWKTRKARIDLALFVIIAAVCTTFLLRVVIVYSLLGLTLTEQTYAQSTYAWIFHFSSAICALALAVVLLLAAWNDMVMHFHGKSNADPLTGLLNRRGLEGVFKSNAPEDQDDSYVRSLIVFDIDHFKHVNDQHGHAAGDKVLQRVAKTAVGLCQEHGEVARTGGEEFAILTYWIPVETAQFLAQHICDSFRFIAHPELGSSQKVTASFGLAVLTDADSLDDAMKRADEALYRSKRNGRNQVTLAEVA